MPSLKAWPRYSSIASDSARIPPCAAGCSAPIRDEMVHHAQDPATYLDRLAAGGDALQGLLNRITVQRLRSSATPSTSRC